MTVDLAVRFDNSGNFVHSAPWSVDDQGKRDVSQATSTSAPPTQGGSSTTSAPVNPSSCRTTGTYTKNDGSNDWQS